MNKFDKILSSYKPHVGFSLRKRLEQTMTNKKIAEVEVRPVDNGFTAGWTVVTPRTGKDDDDYESRYERHTLFFADITALTEWLKTFDFTPAT